MSNSVQRVGEPQAVQPQHSNEMPTLVIITAYHWNQE